MAKYLTPLKAIREKCLDCSAENRADVRHCPVIRCPLFNFRFGKNPNLKGVLRGASKIASKV